MFGLSLILGVLDWAFNIKIAHCQRKDEDDGVNK